MCRFLQFVFLGVLALGLPALLPSEAQAQRFCRRVYSTPAYGYPVRFYAPQVGVFYAYPVRFWFDF